jgi:hypothetical protein
MTQHDSVSTSVGGETTPERGKGGDDVNYIDMDLTGPKSEEKSRS